MVIKCKPRGRVELEKVSEQAYQTNDPSPSTVVVDTYILSNLCSISGKVDIIELSRQHSMCQAEERDVSTEDEDEDDDKEEEFNDDIETESDIDSLQLSE